MLTVFGAAPRCKVFLRFHGIHGRMGIHASIFPAPFLLTIPSNWWEGGKENNYLSRFLNLKITSGKFKFKNLLNVLNSPWSSMLTVILITCNLDSLCLFSYLCVIVFLLLRISP